MCLDMCLDTYIHEYIHVINIDTDVYRHHVYRPVVQVDLPPLKPAHHRVLNIHNNVPGVLRGINHVLADVNVVAQSLRTEGKIGTKQPTPPIITTPSLLCFYLVVCQRGVYCFLVDGQATSWPMLTRKSPRTSKRG